MFIVLFTYLNLHVKLIDMNPFARYPHFLSLSRPLKAFKKRLSKFEEENHGILKGIEGSLIRWMGTVMHYDGPIEEKLELWRNCVKHYMGDHTHCLHGQVPVHYWDKATEPGAEQVTRLRFL